MVQSLAALRDRMRHAGAVRLYAKVLAPNDNSKNQVFLGSGFTSLNLLPHGDVTTDPSPVAGAVRDRAKAVLDFSWLTPEGLRVAPDAKLILYPRYPEVRFSGFLKGCHAAPSAIMTSREPGRVIVLGVTAAGKIVGYAAGGGESVSSEIASGAWGSIGVFLDLSVESPSEPSAKEVLLERLRLIHERSWVGSVKLGPDGVPRLYAARNGGGYTLEALLGISPNGRAEPDFMGWEVKQYAVSNFRSYRAKSAVTLMTPEPTGGVYQDEGPEAFIRRFGYPDRNGRENRLNFGGIYDCLRTPNHLTGLRMVLSGFDNGTGQITDMNGAIMLLDPTDTVAASWTFKGLLAHWNRKHAKAAYVPSLYRTPPPEYAFGGQVLTCEETDFLLFLRAVERGQVYLDPALKLEGSEAGAISIKRRNQFRVSHSILPTLYHRHETVDLTD
ncbi:MAG: hypothetical protein IM671_02750 [Phenylobacterium sp.]|uniref:MvaI/BcnI family restriction endonuclease n=1 Tax=Phenylobacterium sp. TaxID=1871053 RepID=UPI0025FE4B60|nr:MvaI/BcnI family restriction endonuclease [Phenylobacterium sp.]MCA6245624.1 hypothetical protein [Phenylobacterium sp.]